MKNETTTTVPSSLLVPTLSSRLDDAIEHVKAALAAVEYLRPSTALEPVGNELVPPFNPITPVEAARRERDGVYAPSPVDVLTGLAVNLESLRDEYTQRDSQRELTILEDNLAEMKSELEDYIGDHSPEGRKTIVAPRVVREGIEKRADRIIKVSVAVSVLRQALVGSRVVIVDVPDGESFPGMQTADGLVPFHRARG